MSEERSSYRQIMKATSLFGGVQVFNILMGIIRSKFIAVLLGPAGMGIAGLLTSTTGLIASVTNFGLSTSAIKNVAEANGNGNSQRIGVVVSVIKRLVWITGLLGTVVTFVLAPFLSRLTFGNPDYTVAFRWVSVTLLFAQLASGQMVVIQGMRKLQFLAKANIIGSVLGLLVSLPIYYWLGVKGIVPALLVTSALSVLLTYYFTARISIDKVSVSVATIKSEGAGMMKMGFLLSMSGMIGLVTSYILSIFISRYGGIAQVGLYNAGFAIINTYVGMIFAAMVTDYFPRLSAVAADNEKSAVLINQQAEIGILIIAPVLNIFMVFINVVITILYSSKFLPISGMIQYVALGIFLKTVSWAMGYMMLAKGDSKIFFYSELLANIYILLINMICYRLYGLDGLGISFFVCYGLGILQGYIILHWKYQFKFNATFYRIFISQFLLTILCFLLVKFFAGNLRYIITLPVIVIATIFSLNEFNKKLDIIEFVRSKFNK